MLLAGLQALLREFYALDLEYEVDDFLTTDEALARALDSRGRELDEKLLIAEASGEAEVSLYIEPRLLERRQESERHGCSVAHGELQEAACATGSFQRTSAGMSCS